MAQHYVPLVALKEEARMPAVENMLRSATTHWRTNSIKLSAIAGNSDVMFAFENRSGNGCNLYIDNNIPASPTDIQYSI